MLRNYFFVILLPLILFAFNVNSAEINFGKSVISSKEIKSDLDPKKNKITVKNAEVKFNDGSIYNGPIKKNKINGNGKLTLKDGTVHEGKFKSNKFIKKISKKERTFIKLNLKKGINIQNQIKVRGLTKWYPADVINGEFKLSKKGELMASQDKKAMESSGSGGSGGC
tara:strand:+ start:3379 stop:3882 length:504 start_codon:yes stop_codon:yes gene_type:complete